MKWLSIDPGESLGWALWEDDDLIATGTHKGWEFVMALGAALDGGAALDEYLAWGRVPAQEFTDVKRLVVEEFVLYPRDPARGLAPPQDWDKLRTPQFIGALRYIAQTHAVAFVFQPAAIKEQAKAAGAESLFDHPLRENRHQNDAIMHGWYYMTLAGADAAPPEAEGIAA